MSNIMNAVDQRTQLAGTNRLELLVFKLGSQQSYGINVFKIKEILNAVKINKLPGSHPVISGVAHIRGQTIPIFDFQNVLEGRVTENIETANVVVTEYNRSVQGFFVTSVDKIINTNWEDIHPPPAGIGKSCYLTAITNVNNEILELIDVEKILDEVSPAVCEADHNYHGTLKCSEALQKKIIVCDDSAVARKQVVKTLESLDEAIKPVVFKNGRETLEYLKNYELAEGKTMSDEFLFIISDIEMPEMDGYKLTTEIRADPKLADIYLILHSSLSGIFNQQLIEKVGANIFIPKFDPNDIAEAALKHLKELK